MTYIVELNGQYRISNKEIDNIIACDNNKKWCSMWVEMLNENPSKVAYLTETNN